MKKVTGILLILVLIVPFGASYLFLQHQKKTIRKEIKHKIIEGINRDELVQLVFTNEELQTKLKWEHSKEFEYNGEMYDIVESCNVGDTIYFWCWWDHEETQLNKQLNRLLAIALGSNQQSKESSKQLLTFGKSLYFSNAEMWIYSYSEFEELESFYRIIYNSVIITPPAPPPEFS